MELPAYLKTAAKALALTLAVAAIATPTLAAPMPPPPGHMPPPMHNPAPPPPRGPMQPSFNFNFGFDVPGFHFGAGNTACLTDGQIVRELQAKGYTSVRIVGHNFRHSNRNNWVKVQARRGGQTYSFYVDSCRGNVGFW